MQNVMWHGRPDVKGEMPIPSESSGGYRKDEGSELFFRGWGQCFEFPSVLLVGGQEGPE